MAVAFSEQCLSDRVPLTLPLTLGLGYSISQCRLRKCYSDGLAPKKVSSKMSLGQMFTRGKFDAPVCDIPPG